MDQHRILKLGLIALVIALAVAIFTLVPLGYWVGKVFGQIIPLATQVAGGYFYFFPLPEPLFIYGN